MKYPSRRIHRPRTQRGFVLVLTLWVMAIAAIAAAYFSEKVSSAVEMAEKSRQNAHAHIDLDSSRAEILYRLATTSLNVEGLGRGNALIRLDDRRYRASGRTLVQLQDSRGLFNLNQSPDDRLQRFLGLLGVTPEQRSHLVDTLADYTDADKLERINGAEEPQYRARGLPPPTNNALSTPMEVRRIIGWRDMPQITQNRRFLDLTSTASVMGLNPNTAPVEVLATLPGMTDVIARILIGQREQIPILHQGQLSALTGIPESMLEMQIFVTPGNTLRIRQSAIGVQWGLQYSVTLTPNGNNGPWRIDYMSQISMPAQAPDDATPPLPLRSTAVPESPPALGYGG